MIMKRVYYWKIKIKNKELIVYAHNVNECKLLTNAWLKRQSLSINYDVGRPFAIKKNTPADIVEQEFKHLCLEITN